MTSIVPFLVFIFLISMIGGWLPTVQAWSRIAFNLVISFGAGVLLGAVFFHMLPEISHALGKQIGFPIIVGFLTIFILEKFLMVHPCSEGECHYHKIGRAAYVGIGFHSLLDGVAIGAGSMLNLSGVIIMAVTVHRFPEALALSSIFVKGGVYTKQRILASMFLFSLITPLGAVASMLVLENIDIYPLSMALGVSAGTFLYIAIGDLLPTVHEEHEKKYKNLVCFCLGIFSMILSQGLV
ncbi:MAG: ZIP family metal transporter [Nitrospinae bacterium]|nr:ZIP family metal transporter [Nitrospinota bacterium]